jgi:singapore isolate B (sub-type 7) whole genome shotgun sequence assembly, scaffold_0
MLSLVQNLFNDNRKIGVILVSLGMTLLVMGVVLLFDPVLLAMGNILFLGSDV